MARKHKNYDVDEVVRALRRKKDLRINEVNRVVTINSTPKDGVSDIGNGTRGKIDFLTNYKRWVKLYDSWR